MIIQMDLKRNIPNKLSSWRMDRCSELRRLAALTHTEFSLATGKFTGSVPLWVI